MIGKPKREREYRHQPKASPTATQARVSPNVTVSMTRTVTFDRRRPAAPPPGRPPGGSGAMALTHSLLRVRARFSSSSLAN
eukprot:271649-Rhodomonas_salina.1